MEMDRFTSGKTWVVSHKPVAAAAGLGHMGIHRNVIHPRFGNFILLGTVLVDADVTTDSQPINYNPCLECKLCVSACPTGAIELDPRRSPEMTHLCSSKMIHLGNAT
jgi:epoxyqueuosine reductase QueG